MNTFNGLSNIVNHSHSLVYDNATWTSWPNPYVTKAEAEMSLEDRIATERKEARERERIEALFDLFEDEHMLRQREDGTLLRWHVNDVWGAAIKSSDTWYCRGHVYDGDEMVAWLIGRGVEVDDLEVIRP